ncbi:two-component system sensor histidine kinase NtrB [Desulfosporosinus orientis]|uniref:two-component system sensor histidine kinase NtrB n=1 Tax=Desulfosporosinus orientis TaxID=1563 RepID=UPI001FA719E9|nr:PAS domain S-box protein [Desulfosporosinus orientis]
MNFSHLKILSMILLFLDFFFLFTDYSNYRGGLWYVTPGYILLFYAHVIFGVGMIFIVTLYWRSVLQSVEDVRTVHKYYEIFFAVFCLFSCAFVTGWVDQKIHGQLTVYIIGCFLVAVFFNLKPRVSFSICLISYIIVMIGIVKNQSDTLVLKGHFLNTLVLIFVSWFLSLTLYKSRVQDFLHKNRLELLVKERTKELEGINKQLIKEVDERKEIEEKIFRLASIVESSDDGIIGMTLEGIIIDWNRAAEGIYGYSEAEILGLPVSRLLPPDKELELKEILRTVSTGKSISHYETTRLRKDGRIIDVYLTVSTIKNHNGQIIGASTIVRDVTAQKKIEREMARMDQMNLVGEMAASIGHEVRNPMTTVRGFLQLLGEKDNFTKYVDFIPLMISELDRANQIISEFLSISRTKVTEVASHNLNDIINSILPLIQVDVINSEKRLITELGDVPDLVLNDKEIRQLILNLSKNGLEAMPKGGCLTIKTNSFSQGVILSIQDEGSGIEPGILNRLGTPFLTTKKTGTGLGLAVCYGIAARHKAEIIVESSPRGSTFSVKFASLNM